MDKEKQPKELEIEKKDIMEIEHKTIHPGNPEFSLQTTSSVPGENAYVNEQVIKKTSNCGGL